LADETVAGTNDFCVEVYAGTKSKKVLGLKLVVRECLAATITSTVAIVSKQIATVGGSAADMKYKLPEYTNTDTFCPGVSKHAL